MLENHWSMIGQELADVLNKTSYRVQSTLCHVYKRMIWTTTLKLHNMNRSGVVPCNKTVWSRGRTSCYQSISFWIDEALCVTNWFDWIRQIIHNIFLCIVHVALRLIYRRLSMHANIIVKISCKYKLCIHTILVVHMGEMFMRTCPRNVLTEAGAQSSTPPHPLPHHRQFYVTLYYCLPPKACITHINKK